MPRDAFSNYTLPAGNPVVTGTTIASNWANTTLNDIATALTNSLSTDGSTATVSLLNKTVTNATIQSSSFSGTTVTTTGLMSTSGGLTVTGNTTLNTLVNLVSGQIKFPATQIPSADVNTLDDYEEGTWTPVFSFTVPGNLTVNYISRIGTYTKIGNIVNFNMSLLCTPTHSTAGGFAQISGLPFQAANGTPCCAYVATVLAAGADAAPACFVSGTAPVMNPSRYLGSTAQMITNGTDSYQTNVAFQSNYAGQYKV